MKMPFWYQDEVAKAIRLLYCVSFASPLLQRHVDVDHVVAVIDWF